MRTAAHPRVGVEPVHLLAHVPLPALAVDLFHQPDELDRPAAELAGRGDDLRPLDELAAFHPEVEELAGGFLVRRGGDFAQPLGIRRAAVGKVQVARGRRARAWLR